MNLKRQTLAVALLAALVAPAAHAEIAIDVIGSSEVSLEGLIQADTNWFDNDVANLNGDVIDGTKVDGELRRAEIVLKGKGPGNVEWVVGYDAKADKFLDVNARYKLGGDSNHYVQLGQFKQPNSFEELTSTRHNDFISKAAITNTFAVARRLGAAYSVGAPNWSATASYFSRELTRNLAHGNGFGLRGTWAPINETGNILHVGLSYVDMDTDGDFVRLRSRPQADLSGVRLIDTGSSGIRNADRMSTIGAEAMYVRGPIKLQAEYMTSTVDRYATPFAAQPGGDYDSAGYYVSALWNVSGETWGYRGGLVNTLLPDDPSAGMWQVGLRFDHLDLDDGSLSPGATPTAAPIVNGILGGEMDALTVGVNWYWRSNFKFMLNYVKVDTSRYTTRTPANYSLDPAFNNVTFNRVLDDNPNIVEARVQFYW